MGSSPTKKQLPYSPRQQIMNGDTSSGTIIVPKNGFASIGTESAITYSATDQLKELENENKQLKEDLENEGKSWNAKYEKLKESLDAQALNYGKEIDLMRKQMNALQSELQKSITENDVTKNAQNTDIEDNKDEEAKR